MQKIGLEVSWDTRPSAQHIGALCVGSYDVGATIDTWEPGPGTRGLCMLHLFKCVGRSTTANNRQYTAEVVASEEYDED